MVASFTWSLYFKVQGFVGCSIFFFQLFKKKKQKNRGEPKCICRGRRRRREKGRNEAVKSSLVGHEGNRKQCQEKTLFLSSFLYFLLVH